MNATSDKEETQNGEGCVSPEPSIPPAEITRYSATRDPDSEQDIARYVELEASGETVLHVEKIRTEHIVGEAYEIWDVTTDKDRWWVLTNITNLYSQKHFPSLDYTISFHVGLMMRLRSRPQGPDSSDPHPLDEVFRRQEQARNRHDAAVEAEDYQAVGMLLRECLISLSATLRRSITFHSDIERPQDSNFVLWTELICNALCGGDSNKQLRKYLKTTCRETWQLVNWLTHDRDANQTASSICIHACDTAVAHLSQMLMRERTEVDPDFGTSGLIGAHAVPSC